MYVIMDIEWMYQRGKKNVTQLAAIRIDKRWMPMERFNRLVMPQSIPTKWEHVAYTGHSAEDYLGADDIKTVMGEFALWLQKEDVLCFWHYEAKRCLEKTWSCCVDKRLNYKTKVFSERISELLQYPPENQKGLYTVAAEQGLPVTGEKHCAENDAEIFRRLLAYVYSTRERPPMTLVERNREQIEKTQYNYTYTEGSPVFHRRDCRCILRADKIMGSIHYATAAENRRPCKACNPRPRTNFVQDTRIPPTQDDPKAVQKIKLFDGSQRWLAHKFIVGYCRCNLHPGVVSESLLKEHRCLARQCRHLYKYADCAYWSNGA